MISAIDLWSLAAKAIIGFVVGLGLGSLAMIFWLAWRDK